MNVKGRHPSSLKGKTQMGYISDLEWLLKDIYIGYCTLIKQTKKNLLLFIVPIIIFLLLVFFYQNETTQIDKLESFELSVVDQENSLYSGILLTALTGSDEFESFANVNMDSKEEMDKKLSKGEVDASIIIPKGYTESLMMFEYNPVILRVNNIGPLRATMLNSILKSYEAYIISAETGVNTLYELMYKEKMDWSLIKDYNERISYELIFTSLGRDKLYIKNPIKSVDSVFSYVYFSFGVGLLFIMIISIACGINIINEVQSGCILRIMTTKIKLSIYFFSKALSYSLYIYTYILLWSLLLSIPINNFKFTQISYLLIATFFVILFFVSVFILASVFFKDENSMILFSNIYILISALLGGSLVPLSLLPKELFSLSGILPNGILTKQLIGFVLHPNFQNQVILIIVLGAMFAFMTFSAGEIYSRRVKVYG